MSFVCNRDGAISSLTLEYGGQPKDKNQRSSVLKLTEKEMQQLKVEAASCHIYSNLQNKPASKYEKMHVLEGEVVKSEADLAQMIQLFLNCFSLSSDFLIIAILYLDRLVVRCDTADDDFFLTPTNIKCAFFGCLVLATKFHDDNFEKNTIFGTIMGIPRQQLRNIMNLILEVLNFDLLLREQDFIAYENKLKQIMKSKLAEKGRQYLQARADYFNLQKHQSIKRQESERISISQTRPATENSIRLQHLSIVQESATKSQKNEKLGKRLLEELSRRGGEKPTPTLSGYDQERSHDTTADTKSNNSAQKLNPEIQIVNVKSKGQGEQKFSKLKKQHDKRKQKKANICSIF